MSSVIMLRGTGTGGTESAVASIDVPQDGFLLGCWFTMTADCDADNDVSVTQISFGSANSTANDSRQIIAECRVSAQLTTSGSPMTSQNYYVDFHNGLPVGAGERIFMHINASASLTTTAVCGLIFSFDEARARTRRG